jgi:hypothetical protein
VGALLPAIGGSLLRLGTARGAPFYVLELSGELLSFLLASYAREKYSVSSAFRSFMVLRLLKTKILMLNNMSRTSVFYFKLLDNSK